MKKRLVVTILAGLIPALSIANDFPTLERVNYVLFCMDDLGGQSYETLETCSCRIDAIAVKMPFTEYEQATFYERYRSMPGKRGGLVRDNDESRALQKKLKEVGHEAAQQCKPIPHITPPSQK